DVAIAQGLIMSKAHERSGNLRGQLVDVIDTGLWPPRRCLLVPHTREGVGRGLRRHAFDLWFGNSVRAVIGDRPSDAAVLVRSEPCGHRTVVRIEEQRLASTRQ